MEQHRVPAPICTIKMNLRCCGNCPIKMKEKLQKLNGVHDINIDPEQGFLRVQGNVDPMALTKIVQNMDKKAELWSFEKEPSKYRSQNGKDCSCDGDDVDESSSEDESNYKTVPKKQHGILSWAKKGMKKDGKGFVGMGRGMDMPRPPRPPMSRPSMGVSAHRQFYGPPRPGYRPPNPYYQQMMYPRPSPPPYSYYGQMQPPPYTYFRSMSPPKVNPMVHYTSYADNYRYP